MFWWYITIEANTTGREIEDKSLRLVACWGRRFESRQRHGCLFLVYCEVQVPAKGRSLVQRILPAVTCHCVWFIVIVILYTCCGLGRRSWTKKQSALHISAFTADKLWIPAATWSSSIIQHLVQFVGYNHIYMSLIIHFHLLLRLRMCGATRLVLHLASNCFSWLCTVTITPASEPDDIETRSSWRIPQCRGSSCLTVVAFLIQLPSIWKDTVSCPYL